MRILALLSLAVLAVLPVCATTLGFEPAELPGTTAGFGPDPWWSGTPKGTILTNQYASQGVLLSMTANGVDFLSSSTFYPAFWFDSGQALLVNTVPPGQLPAAQLTITFVMPGDPGVMGMVAANTVSLWVLDTEFATQSVRAQTYDMAGSLLETWDLASLSFTEQFTVGNIHRIVLTDLGADGFTMDNVTFGTIESVPEPATALLLFAGLAAAAFCYRRKTS